MALPLRLYPPPLPLELNGYWNFFKFLKYSFSGPTFTPLLHGLAISEELFCGFPKEYKLVLENV